jgi:CRP/FNR family transcriptional regulator
MHVNWEEVQKIREQLEKFGYVKSFDPGEVILEEHSSIRTIPFIIRGSVKVTQTDDDYREILLYYLQPGESCIMSVLGGMHEEKSKLRVIAEDFTEVLFVPKEKIPELTTAYPQWLDYIFKLYHKRFEELLDVVNAVAFKKMDERLLQFLTKKSEIAQSKELNITHEQIAIELGTARVVVSRLLKQLEKEGNVALGRNKVTLV